MKNRSTVAIIGSGISGLTAAYILRQQYDVTLYEAAERLGGHTHTHTLTDSAGGTHAIDSGFVIHNIRTYPLLLRLFRELDVATEPTEMSLSVSCRGCGLEFTGGRGYRGVFAMPTAPFRLRYLKLLLTIKPFFKDIKKFLATPGNDHITLGEFLRAGHYGLYFETHFILPIVSGVWSCEFDEARQYPARYLFQYMDNHGMLQPDNLKGNKDWRVVVDGSNAYVKKIAPLLHKVVRDAAVTKLERTDGAFRVTDSTGATATFDKVVVATHPDQALKLLAHPTAREREILGAFRYRDLAVQLHTDTSVLPRHKRASGSWNYVIPHCMNSHSGIRFSYDMNHIKQLTSPDHYIVSLDSATLIDPAKIIKTLHYQHPLFTLESVAAQAKLASLNSESLAFAGAYHGWGFHEDGCRSGVAAAAALGVHW
ncbi:MAG TPA: FAD-dependent oxidoreductase [Candidatus Saccharimonadia bacterium]|nr:FAD-dependent oxidoreductase [Candidatus Saccharimonadia bacterium]